MLSTAPPSDTSPHYSCHLQAACALVKVPHYDEIRIKVCITCNAGGPNKKVQQSWQTSALAMHLPLARLISMPVIFCLLPSSSIVILVFLPRDALCIVQSAVLKSHVVCPSVRPSVRLSVCDVGDLWSQRLEILETNCTDNYPNTFAPCSRKEIHLLPGEHGEIWGRLEVG